MTASDRLYLTERQRIALDFLALVDRKTGAEVRRDALAAYADKALADADVQCAVDAALSYRRKHCISRSVTVLRGVR